MTPHPDYTSKGSKRGEEDSLACFIGLQRKSELSWGQSRTGRPNVTEWSEYRQRTQASGSLLRWLILLTIHYGSASLYSLSFFPTFLSLSLSLSLLPSLAVRKKTRAHFAPGSSLVFFSFTLVYRSNQWGQSHLMSIKRRHQMLLLRCMPFLLLC